MRKQILVVGALALASVAGFAHADSKARYVGGGRYQCHDRSAECAMVKQNNRHITQDEIDARERRPYHNPDPTFSRPTGHEGTPTQRWRHEDQDNTREQRR